MFTLHVLGGALVEGDSGPLMGRAAHKRRLALLALLAAARTGTVGRERLIGYLWPEHPASRARHLLSESLYVLRKELGEDAFVAHGDDLGLNPKVVCSDLGEFEEAVAGGDLVRAVALYRGPFLDGFFVSDAPEFERWAEAERARVARVYATALETLAAGREKAGDWAGAVEQWRQLAAQDPHSSRIALRLMRALDAAGERTAALAHARVHEAALREELDAPPNPEIAALAERLRAAGSGASPEVPAGNRVTIRATPDQDPAAGEDRIPDVLVPARERPRRWRWTRLTLNGPAAVVLLAALVLFGMDHYGPEATAGASPVMLETWRSPEAPARLAIFPFGVMGEESDSTLGEMAALLLSAGLDGSAGVSVSDARRLLGPAAPDIAQARRLAAGVGASFFVLGEVMPIAGTVRLNAALYSVNGPSEPQAAAHAVGPASSLIAITDSLTMQLLAARGAGEPGGLVRTAARTTESLDAFKAYLEGERHFRQGRHGDALAAFQRAVDIDPRFALAYYRLARVADWAAGGVRSSPAERARALANRLPERERLLVRANLEWERGAVAEAERLLRRALELYPDDPEAGYLLGEVLFHSGPFIGHAPKEARPFFARGAAVEPGNAEALAHLARIEVHLGRLGAADSLARRVRHLRPAGDRLAAELALMMRMAHRDPALLHAGWAPEARASDQEALLYLGAWRLAAYTGNLAQGHLFAQRLATRSTDEALRLLARTRLAEFIINGGRLHDALRESVDPHLGAAWGLGTRAYLVALPFSGADRKMITAYADSLEHWRPPSPPAGMAPDNADANGLTARLAAYPRALLALRLGDTTAAARSAQALSGVAPGEPLGALARGLAHGIRAEVAWARGEHAAALAEFDSATASIPLGHRLDLFGGVALQRFRRAELLRELGRQGEALRWYATLDGGDSAGELAFRAAIARASGR